MAHQWRNGHCCFSSGCENLQVFTNFHFKWNFSFAMIGDIAANTLWLRGTYTTTVYSLNISFYKQCCQIAKDESSKLQSNLTS